MTHLSLSAENSTQSASPNAGDANNILRSSTEAASQILSSAGLSLRVSLRRTSIVIGAPSTTVFGGVEFAFDSAVLLKRVFKRMRLLNFAMAYADGTMEVRGPISKAVEIIDVINAATDRRQTVFEKVQTFAFKLSKAVAPTSFIQFESLDHYANSAEAYELFLDKYLQYTCGRFETGNEDIDQAQIAKFDLIKSAAEKHIGPLRDKSHLDIGCGWGGTVAYFRQEFGMRSIGNTNTPQQEAYAKKHFGSEVIFGDFLALAELDTSYDLITVVGMIEHLTPHRRIQLLDVVRKRLNSGGVLYLQSITKPAVWIGGDAYRFVQKEVFPGHYLDTAAQTEDRLRDSGFEILERYDHGRDYGYTTARWAEHIQKNEVALKRMLGDRQYRVYLSYLAYASRLFATNRGDLMRYVARIPKRSED